MPVLCGSIKVAASVTSTSVAAASTFNSKRISRGTADRISISDDERVKLACSTVNRYMPKGRCWKVKRPASSVLNSRRVWDAALTKVSEEGSARPVESLTESRSSPVSTCPHTNPHASRINPIRIPVLSSYQSRGKTRYPVEYVNSTDEAQAEDIAKTESPMQAETVRLAVIVPAYRPEKSLLQLIGALSEKSIPAIVLVDDGSGPDYRETFRRAEEFPKVRLVRHAINLGKGAALKTGINYALCAFPGLQGVVTADADGQHHPDDIEQVADRLAAEPDRVVLGTRTFSGGVPLRSRVGNVVTRTVMRALVGQNVSDTQTGLRGIPARLLPRLLRLEANGYDFELDMLITVRQQAIRIAEVPIRTIYEPGNRTSHFNPLIDSMKIYFVLLRFSSVSLATAALDTLVFYLAYRRLGTQHSALATAALDTLVFYLAYRRLGNVAASQALGRLLAVAFNYSMVRRTVFYSKLRHASVLPGYLLLVCLSGAASYAGIQLLNSRFHIQLLPAKLLVETLLFFANFAIQRDFIFGKSPLESRPKRAK